MKKIITVIICLFLFFSAINFASSKPSSLNNAVKDTENSITQSGLNNLQEEQTFRNINRLDGFFTENRGQVGNDFVRYYINSKGVWFLDDGVVFEIQEPIKETEIQRDPFDRLHPEFEPERPQSRKSVVLKLNFEGCKKVTPIGRGLLNHRSNFFYGNDSSKWCTDVPNYQEIVYENIYDNIDLKYYISNEDLKYDFIVKPGGNPNDIALRCEGFEDLYIDPNDNLVLHTSLGDIVDSDIFIYQNLKNKHTEIAGKFRIIDVNTYGFELLIDYDRGQTLIIDPLVYSTYIGSSGFEYGYGIDVDSNGYAYITGFTDASNFPVAPSPGAYDETHDTGQDVFILKLNQNATNIIYSTYLGGGGNEEGHDIKVDSSGIIYVTGYTTSDDFPTTTNAYQTSYQGVHEAFIVKLNPAGNGSIDLNYSTYLGGTNYDMAYAIVLDSNNNVYISGETQSTDFPTTPGAYNVTLISATYTAFISKLNLSSNGTNDLIYSTFIGGSTYDKANGVAVDTSGDIYVTGFTYSTNFPVNASSFQTTNGGQSDAFISKLNPGGNGANDLVYSTYIGGSQFDEARDIDIDSSGNAYIIGRTDSTDFPTTPGVFDGSYNGIGDMFVFKLNQSGSGPVYSTFIGDVNDEQGEGIVVDSFGNAYITGTTFSVNFPTTGNANDTSHNGEYDAVVIKLSLSGASLEYSTFFGASKVDLGYAIAVDSEYKMYVTGITTSNNIPTSANAFQPSYNGGTTDGFVIKLEFNNLPNIIDLNISTSKILRTSTIYLYANATDIEDPEYNLTPSFEYRDSNKQVWNNTHFSNIKYNNSRWEASFTPPKNATVGLYDLRVRVNDTIPQFSEWFCINDSLMVLNNYPNAIDLLISKSTSIQNNNISLCVNSTDIEDEEYNLTLETMYRDPSEQFWNVTFLSIPIYYNNRWGINFSAPFGAPFGYYDFKARVCDMDGNYSHWLFKNDSLLVYNVNPEVTDIELSKSTIYRTESVDLYVNGSDHETLEPLLTFYGQYKTDLDTDWTDLTGSYFSGRWSATFTPNIDASIGVYDFRAKFTDLNNGIGKWQYLNDSLTVYNHPPNIENILLSNDKALLGDTVKIRVNGIDIEEPEENLTAILQYRNPHELTWESSYLHQPNYITDLWEFEFDISFDAPFGYYDFRAKFNDSDHDYTKWLYKNDSLLVHNTPPSVFDIIIYKSSLYRTESIFLHVNGLDHETPEAMLVFSMQYKADISGDWLNLYGDYSNDNETWEALFVTSKESTLGLYDFRVKFEDNESVSSGWIYLNNSLEVLNNLPLIIGNLDDINVSIDPILIDLTQYESDIEDDNRDLVWNVDEKKYNYLESVSIIDTINDILKIVPSENVSGEVDIKLILTDKDNGTAVKSNITIYVDSRWPMHKPKVTLVSPPDKSIVNTLKPKLEWELDYIGEELITYSIFLNENAEPITKIDSELIITSYTLLDELVDGKTYYWKVIPKGGICVSEPFSFTIDLDFVPIYKVNLTSEKEYFVLKQGASAGIDLTIKNEGNSVDTYKIDFGPNILQSQLELEKSKIQLEPDFESKIKLNVSIPDDFECGNYAINILATSLSDETVIDVISINIEVVTKEFVLDYKVSMLLSQDSVDMEQGKSENLSLTITNDGNVRDDYSITFESEDFGAVEIKLSKSTISLDSGDHEQITIRITVPENMVPGDYTIKFIVESPEALNETSLTIKVQEKGDEIETEDGKDNSMLYTSIGIIVIVIIVLILLFLFVLKKKPPKDEPELIEQRQFPGKPLAPKVQQEQLPQATPQPKVEPHPQTVVQLPKITPAPQLKKTQTVSQPRIKPKAVPNVLPPSQESILIKDETLEE